MKTKAELIKAMEEWPDDTPVVMYHGAGGVCFHVDFVREGWENESGNKMMGDGVRDPMDGYRFQPSALHDTRVILIDCS